MGVAIGALVLLTAGVAVGGMLETPGPTGSPSPSGPAEAAATGSGPLATPPLTPSPAPEPTPAVTLDPACGSVPTSVDVVRVVLSAPGTAPVAGVPQGGEPPSVSVDLGDLVDLTVAGNACATSWNIELLGAENGEPAVVSPGTDPARAAQNHWAFTLPVGEFRLIATLRFGPRNEVTREWRVTGRGFTVPDTFLVDADGTRVPALPGCGLSIGLANGFGAADTCGSIGYPEGLRTLRVPAWSRVVLEVPGWTIVSWNGECGRIEADQTGVQSFQPVNGCSLGAYSVEPGATPPAPAQFLARPGEQVIQLGVSASRAGDSFSVPMFALVRGE